MSGLLLTKAVAMLLLPPGGLIVLGLAGLLFRRRAWGVVLAATAWLLLWTLSTAPVSDMLLKPLETQYPVYHATRLPPGLAAQTAIVLLGGGIYRQAPEYGGSDNLGKDAMMRTLYAAELARKTGVDVYASGGTALEPGAEPSGAIMARWLVRLGVPAARVHAENAAENTWQNAADVKPMLARAGVKHVILVTNAYHMPRAIFCFSRQGMDAVAAPCAYLRRQAGGYDLLDYLPDWSKLGHSGVALHEYLGLLWYRLHYG